MSTLVEGGRPLARFRVLGFPVHVDLSFLVVIAVLGIAPGIGWRGFVAWLVVAPLAVLVHELGHALTARLAGASPSIALAGLGGVTSFVPPAPLSRLRSIGISLAGPAVGIAVGLAFLYLRLTFLPYPGTWWEAISWAAIFTTLVWSVLNLLPILPLDGGQTLAELLPGAPAQRLRRAAMVSVLVAGALGVYCVLRLDYIFGAVFAALLVMNNLASLRAPAAAPAPDVAPLNQVIGLLVDGRPGQARDALAALPPAAYRDLAVDGAVLSLTGQPEQGRALLLQEVGRRPGEALPVQLLFLVHLQRHEWDQVGALLTGPYGHQVPAELLQQALARAQQDQRPDVVARIQAQLGGPVVER